MLHPQLHFSDFHNLFGFFIHQLLNVPDIIIRHFLQFILKFFHFVFRYILFCQLLKCFITVPPDITDSNLALLRLFLNILYQIFPALLRQLREHQPDHRAVIGRRDPHV